MHLTNPQLVSRPGIALLVALAAQPEVSRGQGVRRGGRVHLAALELADRLLSDSPRGEVSCRFDYRGGLFFLLVEGADAAGGVAFFAASAVVRVGLL